MAAHPLLLLGFVGLGTGYVILPGSHKYPEEPPFGLYWGTAAYNNENAGLAAGLAFVYSPSLEAFCDALIVQMRENTNMIAWADCEQIQNAVMRAMQTWEANHQAIKFVDVTQACERESLTNPDILEDMRNCAHAELVVSAGPPEETSSTVAALVKQYNTEWNSPNQKGPLNTAGGSKSVDFGIQRVRAARTLNRHFGPSCRAITPRVIAPRTRLPCTFTITSAGTWTTRSAAASTSLMNPSTSKCSWASSA